MKPRAAFALSAIVWMAVGLACETGEILTAEEATQRAQATVSPVANEVGGVGAQFRKGDEVAFFTSEGRAALYQEPGELNVETYVDRNEPGIVVNTDDLEGEQWSHVRTEAGEGWVRSASLIRTAAAGSDDGGIQVGDSAALAAEEFLVSFYAEAGGGRIVAAQERGATVTVLAMEESEGMIWYRVEGTAGTGWVPADKIEPEGLER